MQAHTQVQLTGGHDRRRGITVDGQAANRDKLNRKYISCVLCDECTDFFLFTNDDAIIEFLVFSSVDDMMKNTLQGTQRNEFGTHLAGDMFQRHELLHVREHLCAIRKMSIHKT